MTVRFLKSAAVIASLAVAPVAYAQSAAPTAASTPADFYKMKLGHFTIVALSDGTIALPTDQLLVERTPGEVKTILAAANAPTLQTTSVNAYLIDTGSRRILVDSGSGSYFGPTLGRAITALKAAGGLWLLARTVHKVRKVAVGAVVAGAAYGVARAHSPQTADKVLEVGKAGLEKGNVIGSSFWSGVSKGMGETTAGAEFDDDNVRVTTTGSGWGGSGSIEHLLKRDVRGLAPGSYAGYAEAMRSEGYDSVAMLRSLAQSSSSSDWTRMVDACGIRAGDALKIKRALLDKQP